MILHWVWIHRYIFHKTITWYTFVVCVCFKAGRWNNSQTWNKKLNIFYKVFTWTNHASLALQEQTYDSEPLTYLHLVLHMQTEKKTTHLIPRLGFLNLGGRKNTVNSEWSGQQVICSVSSLLCKMFFLLPFVADEEKHVGSVITLLARGKKRVFCMCLDWSPEVPSARAQSEETVRVLLSFLL